MKIFKKTVLAAALALAALPLVAAELPEGTVIGAVQLRPLTPVTSNPRSFRSSSKPARAMSCSIPMNI